MPENKIDKSVGQVLKEARLSKNITIEEASKNTKIHPNILKSMENDDFESLGTIYAKSFVKLYAEYLSLDKDQLTRNLQRDSSQASSGAARKVRMPGDEKDSRAAGHFPGDLISGAVSILKKIDYRVVIAILVAFFLVTGIAKLIKHHKAASRVTFGKMVSEKKTGLQKQVIQVAIPGQDIRLSGDEESRSSELATAAPLKTQDKIVLTIRAKAKNWIQVKVDGKVVFQNMLARGTAETWAAKEKIELMLGNAGANQLELNGKLLEKIGRPGQTLRHVVVTKSGLAIQK